MSDNSIQPKRYDAVLGSSNSPASDSIVLGGIEGVKNRLAADSIASKLAALLDALNYEDNGLDLITEALHNQPLAVRRLAYSLLRKIPQQKAKQAIETCNQYQFFDCLHIIEGHSAAVTCLALVDNSTLVSASRDTTVKVWDLTTGQVIRTLKLKISQRSQSVFYIAIAVSKDGQILCTCTEGDSAIEVWNLGTGEKIYSLEGHSSRDLNYAGELVISPNIHILFSTAYDNIIKVWDLQTGKKIRDYKLYSAITSLCISPDGQTLICGCYQAILLLNSQTGNIEKSIPTLHEDWIYQLIFSQDGKYIIGRGGKTIQVWDVKTGTKIKTIFEGANVIALYPDGKTLVACPEGKPIKLWNLHTGKVIKTLGLQSAATTIGLAVSADGQTLFTGSGRKDPAIRQWNLEEAQQIRIFSGLSFYSSHCLDISRNGKILASCDDYGIKVWDIATKQEIYTLQGHSQRCDTIAISSDCNLLASGSKDKTVKLWNLKTGQEICTLGEHIREVITVAFTPDGKFIVSCGFDISSEHIKIWDVNTGKLIRTLSAYPSRITCIAVNPFGTSLFTGISDNAIFVWDLESGEEIGAFIGHQKPVKSIAITPDGKTLVSGSEDCTIKIWDIQTAKCMFTLSGHSRQVYSIAITPYGKEVISGSDDGTIKIWDLETATEINTLGVPLSGGVYAIAITPDGETIVSTGAKPCIKIWGIP